MRDGRVARHRRWGGRGTAPFVRSPRVPQGTVMELLVTTLADEL